MQAVSMSRQSGFWPCTALSIIFVLTQNTGWTFDRSILPSLFFWFFVGLALDLWSRRLPANGLPDIRRKKNKNALTTLLIAGLLLGGLWTAFRPSRTTISAGDWIMIVDQLLDNAELILPGLHNARAALIAAGRPDVAAYFGAYQLSAIVLWVVTLTVLARLLGVSPAAAVRTKAMVAIMERVYPPDSTEPNHGGRAICVCASWVALAIIAAGLFAFWHQEVANSDRAISRFWHNAISGLGAFFPGILVTAGLAPIAAYAAVGWRAALRLQKHLWRH